MVVMLITGIAAIFIALLAFFFIRSGDEERRMEGNWNCSAGCGSLKTISFSMKGKPYELSYTRAQAGAADEIIRGNWVMNIKDSVLTLTPSLPGGTDPLSAGATATYKYSMIKNTLTLTRQGSNTATVNPVIFVKD